MKDIEIINNLQKICKFKYIIENEVCTNISFYDENEVFESTIRKHPLKNQIIDIISKLENLKFLNIRKAKINYLPEFISKELTYVDISCNDLEKVPKWIYKQKKLNFLNLGANKLFEINDLSDLPIEVLKIHKNNIANLPDINDKIKILNLYLNPMKEIPINILKLSLLEIFSFGVTNVIKIPSLISLKNLKWLVLTVNKIEYLPEDICYLNKLEGLQLAKNKLKELPKNIGNLNINALTLYSNELKEVPKSFYELNLKKLNLELNSIKDKEKIKQHFNKIEFFRI